MECLNKKHKKKATNESAKKKNVKILIVIGEDKTKLHYEKTRKHFYWTFEVVVVVGVPGSRRGWLRTLKLTLNTIKQPVDRPAIIYLKINQIYPSIFFVYFLLLIMSNS